MVLTSHRVERSVMSDVLDSEREHNAHGMVVVHRGFAGNLTCWVSS